MVLTFTFEYKIKNFVTGRLIDRHLANKTIGGQDILPTGHFADRTFGHFNYFKQYMDLRTSFTYSFDLIEFSARLVGVSSLIYNK